ncbi:ExbD/TolR family protein [Candidatus Venteria ishoeyi]|uniref:Biopolymer transport protein ExbD n=1 Tax=Candidatus Venteria ishoeyi TaxID=1899563 RepID=A0A1H6FC42_9GAMM|nr:biopolymer transporter ExbD [Candidatus Venteria ishoeyi]MDM8545739.1 biopolymer transporter ExbD [Candidatus Venteria ishoeyi]SEH07627.1 Biopolymer transport protein ExbD [Candidatus Venteria ishoeyi]
MNLRHHLPEDSESLIDLAPLIDVVFILLIFFMVSTTFVQESELEVNLPEASKAPSAAPPQTITVQVDSQGHFAVGGKTLFNDRLDTLRRALEREIKKYDNDKPSLLINADGGAPHRAVVMVMDAAQQAGIRQVGIATRSPEQD